MSRIATQASRGSWRVQYDDRKGVTVHSKSSITGKWYRIAWFLNTGRAECFADGLDKDRPQFLEALMAAEQAWITRSLR